MKKLLCLVCIGLVLSCSARSRHMPQTKKDAMPTRNVRTQAKEVLPISKIEKNLQGKIKKAKSKAKKDHYAALLNYYRKMTTEMELYSANLEQVKRVPNLNEPMLKEVVALTELMQSCMDYSLNMMVANQ